MSCETFIFGGTGLLGLNWIFKSTSNNLSTSIHKRNLIHKNINTFKVKKIDEKKILEIIDEVKPKIIINTIGMTSIEQCEKNKEQAFYTNVEIPRLIAKASKERCIKFVHISTDHLFDGKKNFYTEECDTSPLNFYGKTKAEAEEKVLKENKNSLVIRTNFYCWGPLYSKSFSDFIYEALFTNQKLNLFNDVFYTPIKADELKKNINLLVSKDSNGIFNISSSKIISKYEFGWKLAEIFNLDKELIAKSSIVTRKDLIIRPKNMSLSNLKIKKELNISFNSLEKNLLSLKNELNSEYYRQIKNI